MTGPAGQRSAPGAAPGEPSLETYRLLQNLASPIVAITCAEGGRRNGCIVNSAVRASIAPRHPRVAVYLHKFNLTHEMVSRAGAFALHLLRDDQWELIHDLGFRSGREGDKLASRAATPGPTGSPLLADCWAAFDCRVANRMDAGPSTVFLGDVVDAHRGSGERIMTAAHFRAHVPDAMRVEYEANLGRAQAWADAHAEVAR